MKKYPSIEQFRNIVRKVKDRHDFIRMDDNFKPVYQHTSKYPVLKFMGTVKLHGTNAGIVKYGNGVLDYQSRERVLSLDQDNSGFMNAMIELNWNSFLERFSFKDSVAIYGEWCGGSIQKGVALNQLSKMFVIFGVKVDDVWVDLPKDFHFNSVGVYNILQFPTFEIDIDFENPELSQNKMIELTLEVEKECPVGSYFGVIGIGEGIVFTNPEDQDLKFKSKGEKHSVSKVKVLNSIDTELLENIKDFIEMSVTDNRLNQGLEYIKETNPNYDIKQIGLFLSWVVKDVLKEESDNIIANNLDEKKVKNAIVQKARNYFLEKL